MIDVISRILCIIIAALPSVAVVVLCISLYKNLDKKFKQEAINLIKQQAYNEVLSDINDRLSTCDIITDGEYRGYECVDVENMLIQLEGKYEIYS